MKKIIAVSSEGGHWKQLSLLSDFLSAYNVQYVTTNKKIPAPNGKSVLFIPDANKSEKLRLVLMFLKSLYIYLVIRPDVVISTGAAPGFSMIFWASLFRKKSIWIDSVANANELSLSGKLAKKYATVVLSQWAEVAEKENVYFKGTLLG